MHLDETKHSPWYELCLYNLKDYEKCFNLHSLWHKTLARKITNNFWQSTLLSWAKVIDSISKDQNDKVLDSPLWYNPTMLNVPLFYQDWYNKGVIFIADLFCASKLLSLEDLTRTLKKLIFWIITVYKIQLSNLYGRPP